MFGQIEHNYTRDAPLRRAGRPIPSKGEDAARGDHISCIPLSSKRCIFDRGNPEHTTKRVRLGRTSPTKIASARSPAEMKFRNNCKPMMLGNNCDWNIQLNRWFYAFSSHPSVVNLSNPHRAVLFCYFYLNFLLTSTWISYVRWPWANKVLAPIIPLRYCFLQNCGIKLLFHDWHIQTFFVWHS